MCRQFFLKTLAVSEKASRLVLDKKEKGTLGGSLAQAKLHSMHSASSAGFSNDVSYDEDDS